MKKQTKVVSKQEPRNLGVTVVAGMLAVCLGMFAKYLLTGTPEQFWYGVAIAVVAVLLLAVAIYGRKAIFKVLLELILWI